MVTFHIIPPFSFIDLYTMEKLVLHTEPRDLGIKLSHLRSSKRIPAVSYGHAMTSQNLSVDYSEFLKIYRKAGGTHLVELMIDGAKKNVLIHEVQKDPVSGNFLHIDFFAVSMKEHITVDIPLVLVGKSQAAVEGAEIEQNLHAINVRVLPSDLIDSIEVDITPLEKTGDIIHVESLVAKYPKLEILTPAWDAIVAAHAPRVHEEAIEATPLPGEEAEGAAGGSEASAEGADEKKGE